MPLIHEQEEMVLEKADELRPPPLYKVLLLNDDYTPMDFVILILETIFCMSREKATQVMLQVHQEGLAVCGIFPRDIAEGKAQQVVDLAKTEQHPLQCLVEQA